MPTPEALHDWLIWEHGFLPQETEQPDHYTVKAATLAELAAEYVQADPYPMECSYHDGTAAVYLRGSSWNESQGVLLMVEALPLSLCARGYDSIGAATAARLAQSIDLHLRFTHTRILGRLFGRSVVVVGERTPGAPRLYHVELIEDTGYRTIMSMRTPSRYRAKAQARRLARVLEAHRLLDF